MSVIVFDGKTLAADSHVNNGQMSFAMNKIIEVPANPARGTPRTLVGAVGDVQTVAKLLAWAAEGRFPEEKLPDGIKDPYSMSLYGGYQLVTVTKEQGLIRYSGNPTPLLHGFNKIAIGEGAPFAYGAMSALEELDPGGYFTPGYYAVKAAIKHSPVCNGEPITLTL